MKITAHTLVKNEENFIWYAINSVINCVDEVLVWDTGSTDKTVPIIKSIKNSKIKFKEVGRVDVKDLADARQKMLDETQADWIFILDGDEIWPQSAIENCKLKIKNSRCDVVVVPNHMLIGDIFHYQEESAGRYKIAGRVGHYNVRAIRKIPGLRVEGIYPDEAYVAKEGIKVQDLEKERIFFLDEPYLHASFLPRSLRGNKKIKYEIGEEFPKDFYYPEAFFRSRPEIVPSPWQPMTGRYKLNALWQTPLKKIKRRLI